MSSHDLPRLGKPQPGKSQSGSPIFLVVIVVGILIDAFLIAQVQANYIYDHGVDISWRHPAVAKLPPPDAVRQDEAGPVSH
jgi:hypothetical protein